MTTTQIPLFPLLQPLFPGTRLNLQIFEQRYLRMITQCLKTEGTFGVVRRVFSGCTRPASE